MLFVGTFAANIYATNVNTFFKISKYFKKKCCCIKKIITFAKKNIYGNF